MFLILPSIWRNLFPGHSALPFDDEDFIRELLDDAPVTGHAVGKSVSVTSVRTCRRVVFGCSYAFLPVEGTITAVGPKGAVEKSVKDLAIGEIVLFVNGDQRRSIYEVMLAEIKKSPAFSLSADIIEAWHRRLKAEFVKSGMTGSDLHRRLRDAGSKVVGVTVRGWLRGSVMSPLESDNRARLFAVFGIPDPDRRHSRRIDQAALGRVLPAEFMDKRNRIARVQIECCLSGCRLCKSSPGPVQ